MLPNISEIFRRSARLELVGDLLLYDDHLRELTTMHFPWLTDGRRLPPRKIVEGMRKNTFISSEIVCH